MERLTIPGTLDSLSSIRAYVLKVADQAKLEKKAAYRLSLAVDEIATNAVLHGYQSSGQTGNLSISAEVTDMALIVTLVDTGPAYDPRNAEIPDDIDAPLSERDAGGLGVFLALGGIDEFRHTRVDGANINVFIMMRTQLSDS